MDIGTFIFQIFWMLFVLSMFVPFLRSFNLKGTRMAMIRDLENKRKSRVITLIHRQEAMSFFGLKMNRFIDIEDSEEVLRAIKMTPDDMPIDFIIHTPGGLVLAAEQIARALKNHKGKVTVFVPHYAMSGGTLIALSADEIVMDENAVLGPLDPQIGQYPAASILSVLERKDKNSIDDETMILADISKKAIEQMKKFVRELLVEKMDEEKAEELANKLCTGTWTHDYPITIEEAQELGLKVNSNMPEEIYSLMNLYKQTEQRRPSVQYIPLPYRKSEKNND
nr:ATP-dependent Clp protease proteolytic subunit [Kosmotoga pacifica]